MTIFDFATPDELQIIKKHISISDNLALEHIDTFWRDENNTLCIMYLCGNWWHYSNNGEWW